MAKSSAPAERWPTKEDIDAARTRMEAAIPGWERPYAYGLALFNSEDETIFPVVNVGAGHLPAAVLATVCGHTGGTAVHPLEPEQIEEAIRLLEPAEACPDYEHPNLRAWRWILDEIVDPDDWAVAVFVADPADPVIDIHDARFRALIAGR
ncbi:hypothetical protein [Actinomadura alba]|uniref:Uncharacterized protein n=1 Tax=Actinomadura alba TaxID=406431 RepID=A0ABR7M2Q8_9ACTN|nr:hypothetical protein [Actinomadura alba]MBC6471198.1 hypothetical protein [Actinomadura alba]